MTLKIARQTTSSTSARKTEVPSAPRQKRFQSHSLLSKAKTNEDLCAVQMAAHRVARANQIQPIQMNSHLEQEHHCASFSGTRFTRWAMLTVDAFRQEFALPTGC